MQLTTGSYLRKVGDDRQTLAPTYPWVRLYRRNIVGTIVLTIRIPLSSTMSLNFKQRVYEVEKLLQTGSSESSKVSEALDELQATFPIPPTEIVSPDIWGTRTPYLRINIHVTASFAEAVNNIEGTGREFTSSDERWLRLILSHWCGWSATKSKHKNEAWVKYLQQLYSHLEGLVPILDSLAWPEDLAHYPAGLCPPEPSLFLLANAHAYYVFELDDLGLCRAGETLEQVYMGLKECKYRGGEGEWPVEEWFSKGLELDERDFFPIYERHHETGRAFEERDTYSIADVCSKDDGIFVLRHPLKEFPTVTNQNKPQGYV